MLSSSLNRFEDIGIETTDNINESIFILPKGQMIWGEFDMGVRSLDHHSIESLYDDLDRYDDDFWEKVVERTNIIQYVPETNVVLIKKGQKITDEQRSIINKYKLLTEIY